MKHIFVPGHKDKEYIIPLNPEHIKMLSKDILKYIKVSKEANK